MSVQDSDYSKANVDFDVLERKPVLCHSCGEVFIDGKQFANHVQTCGVITSEVYCSPPRIIEHVTIKEEIESEHSVSAEQECDVEIILPTVLAASVPTMSKETNFERATLGETTLSEELSGMINLAYEAVLKHEASLGEHTDFYCNMCKKPLLSETSMKGTNTKPYLCDECKNFKDGHVQEWVPHGKANSNCEQCGESFGCGEGNSAQESPLSFCQVHTQTSKAKKHLSLQKPDVYFSCEKCGKVFARKTLLKQHMISHSEQRPYVCDQCGKCFRRRYCLRHHMTSHTNVRPHACNVCGKTFIHKYQLKRHESRHSQLRSFTCSQCPNSYSQRHEFLRHFHSHRNPKPHICEVCDKHFASHFSLSRHSEKHAKKQLESYTGPYVCNTCNETFAVSSHLRQHKLTHRDSMASYTCDVCGKVYVQQYRFIQHKLTHSRSRVLSCEECHKCFPSLYSLKIHKIIHSNERPYVCTECGKTFKYKSALKQHETTHKKEKPFSCAHCGKSFATKCLLKGHLICHSRERAFCCDECGKTFIRSNHLREHKRLKHNKNQPSIALYICERCNKIFKTKILWRRHLLVHANLGSCDKVATVSCSISLTHKEVAVAETCGTTFNSTANLKEIQAVYSSNNANPLRCKMCLKYFPIGTCIKNLSVGEGGNKWLCCEDCSNSVNTSKSLSEQRLELSLKEMLVGCSKDKDNSKEKAIPPKISDPLKTNVTVLSGKEMSANSAKNKEIIMLTPPKMYTFHLPPSESVTASTRDKQENNTVSPKRYTCQLCKLVYAHMKDYTAHMLSHSTIIPVKSEDKRNLSTAVKCVHCGTLCSKILIPQELDGLPLRGEEKPFCSEKCRNAFRYRSSYSRKKTVNV